MNETEDIIKLTNNWLEKPIITNAVDAIQTSDTLLKDLQKVIQLEGASRKEIGSLIGRVRGIQKSLNTLEKIDWVSIGDGHLAIGHRPSSKLINDLKLQNTTHVLTLLSENEGAQKIQAMSGKSDLGWLWFPMESAKPPREERYKELARLFVEIKNTLKQKGRIYIHCSAGIHRTGMITFAFLRFFGLDIETSQLKLRDLRMATSDGIGEERMAWGNAVVDALLQNT